MRRFASPIILLLFLLLPSAAAHGSRPAAPPCPAADEKVICFPDGKVFDFGDITVADGPQKCSFTYRNTGTAPLVINDIISSCGCTKPVWDREAVEPGKTGTIEVTFANDQGAYPFDKTLTVYVSGLDRPLLLHIRGVVHEKVKPLGERFPVHVGGAGLRTLRASLNYIEQGTARSDRTMVANLSDEPLHLECAEASDGLQIRTSPDPVPPRSTATLWYSVDTRLTKGAKWGREKFSAKLSVNGRQYDEIFEVDAFIRDDFSDMSRDALLSAPLPEPERSYYEFGVVAPGKKVTASFRIANTGKNDLIIRKIDSDSPEAAPLTACPLTIRSGASALIKVALDTRHISGESVTVVSLVTNSPKKPVVNLFVTGIVN